MSEDLDLFKIGASILGSNVNDSNNAMSLSIGDAVSQEVTGPKVQYWQQVGFASRPALADPNVGSAESICIERPNGDVCIATRDLRDQKIYGNISNGDTCIYATGANGEGQPRAYLNGNDGSITLITTTDSPDGGSANTDSGVGVYFRIDSERFQFMAPWGNITFDRSGFHIKTSSGAGFDITNMPSSMFAFGGNNQIRMTASQITIDAPSIFLGPSPLQGGAGYMPAAYGIVPGPLGVPILGVGVGAVTIAASSSTKVFISP